MLCTGSDDADNPHTRDLHTHIFLDLDLCVYIIKHMEAMNATNRHLEEIMSFQDLVKITKPRYQAIEYQGDAEYENLVALIEKAEQHLSPAAQAEFAQAWSFDYALDGIVYLGGKRTAKAAYPHLLAEAEAAGIAIETR